MCAGSRAEEAEKVGGPLRQDSKGQMGSLEPLPAPQTRSRGDWWGRAGLVVRTLSLLCLLENLDAGPEQTLSGLRSLGEWGLGPTWGRQGGGYSHTVRLKMLSTDLGG